MKGYNELKLTIVFSVSSLTRNDLRSVHCETKLGTNERCL